MSDVRLRTVVVDDEPLAAALISSYVQRTPSLELVAELNDSEQALAMAIAGGVDLMFLDIHMPHLDGLRLASKLPANTRVVFTTAYSDHALDGFGVNALHYLLKPVSYEEFLEAVSRALAVFHVGEEAKWRVVPSATNAAKYILVKSEYKLLRIPVADIEYIEGLKDYIKIYVRDSDKPILTIMSMKAAEELLAGENFLRVHRSFIVNMNRVRVVERNCILMGGRAIPVSENSRSKFATALGLGD